MKKYCVVRKYRYERPYSSLPRPVASFNTREAAVKHGEDNYKQYGYDIYEIDDYDE